MKVLIWILKAIYKITGLKSLVDYIDLKVTNYRIRLNIVPVTYKVFLVMLGAIGAYAWNTAYIQYEAQAKPLILEQATIINKVEAKEIEEVKEETKEEKIDRLSSLIWERESTNGKNNYSKCEEKGKVNGIGYGIPGNGSYMCFESHEEEMEVLKGWLITKMAQGKTELEMLCIYSGSNYTECK